MTASQGDAVGKIIVSRQWLGGAERKLQGDISRRAESAINYDLISGAGDDVAAGGGEVCAEKGDARGETVILGNGGVAGEIKAPSTKHQAPGKHQAPNPNWVAPSRAHFAQTNLR